VRHTLAVDEKCDFYRQACLQGSMLVLRLLSGSKMGFCSTGAIHCSNKCEIWHEGAVLLAKFDFCRGQNVAIQCRHSQNFIFCSKN